MAQWVKHHFDNGSESVSETVSVGKSESVGENVSETESE